MYLENQKRNVFEFFKWFTIYNIRIVLSIFLFYERTINKMSNQHHDLFPKSHPKIEMIHNNNNNNFNVSERNYQNIT